MIADLHIHSHRTDSTLSFEEIVATAKMLGVGLISITDHDTTEMQEAYLSALAEDKELCYIKGIEISAFDKKENVPVHILGYAYTKDALLEDFCGDVNRRRKEAGFKMADHVINLGYALSLDDMLKFTVSGVIYRQHIAHALSSRGYGEFATVYRKLFYKGSPASFPFEYADAYEAVSAIKQAGGLAVVAHPAKYNNWNCIPRLIDAGLNGLELHHPNHTSRDAVALLNIANDHKLFTTSGSDFHGMYAEAHTPIGHGCVAPCAEIAERI